MWEHLQDNYMKNKTSIELHFSPKVIQNCIKCNEFNGGIETRLLELNVNVFLSVRLTN